MATQDAWRFCQKCYAMFFAGFPQQGVCPAGGAHAAQGYDFFLPHDIGQTPTAQSSWRYCQKCSVMFYAGYPQQGSCAAGGAHSASGFNFTLPHDIPATGTSQNLWHYCGKCHSMFYTGYPQQGRCPSGGAHAASGYNFVLPHDIAPLLVFNFNPIVFGNGVPVGGSAQLTIRNDGTYTFTGHFHDSGATEYNMALVWAVKDSQNIVYTFQHTGHVSGTFESGSRDDNWTIDSKNDTLIDNWAYLGASAMGSVKASATLDLINLTNSLIGSLGTVLGIVAIVIA